MTAGSPLLDVHDLSVSFRRYRGLLAREWSEPLRGVSVALHAGELVALVGASGAGKSLLVHALLGLLPANAHTHGAMHFDGAPLTPARLRGLRGREIALVPQALTFLDPLARAGTQLRWAARAGGGDASPGATPRALERYGLAPAAAALYPHQLSGGMARRVLTAMATVGRARLLLADEPTSGLDAGVRALALAHLRGLADEGRGVLVITHDLPSVLPLADRIIVMDGGRGIETTTASDFFAGRLREPYSRALRDALPAFGFAGAGRPALAPAPANVLPALEANAGPVVRMRGLGFAWPGSRRALFQDLDLDLHPNQWVALQGPSGCGKTTLARLLSGQLAAQRGSLTIVGRGAPDPVRQAHPVQWVHQHAELAFNPRRRIGESLHEGWSPSAEVLQRFGIEPSWLQRFPHELSGGELQRVNIVRALVPGLRLLIADEITAMHDGVTQAALWCALRETLVPRGVAVLVISHDGALIDALSLRRLALPWAA